jgi:hypothetical protein
VSQLQIRAFECGVAGTEWRTTVHATTRGKAKMVYFLDVKDSWPDVKYTEIRCRVLGTPRNTPEFEHTKKYREVSFNIGDRVSVGGSLGFIVDRNNSANFDIEFTAGRYEGCRLNCHPSEIAVVPQQEQPQ